MRKRIGPLLFVAFLAAFLGGVIVPNLREAQNRSNQKRTMADMRTIATALEARATAIDSYALGPVPVTATATQFASLTPVPMHEVQRALVPKYVRKLPTRDGWDNEFEVRVSANSYALRSPGNDDRFDADDYDMRLNKTYAEDIVFSNGNFVRYPEGS